MQVNPECRKFGIYRCFRSRVRRRSDGRPLRSHRSRARDRQDRRRRRVFRSAGDARRGVVRHLVQRLPSSGPRRRQRPGASGRALRADFRRQRFEDALHENRNDDAARRGGEPGRCRVPRHRRARTQGKRISCRRRRADGRGAVRRPGASGQSEAAAARRRFLVRRSGGMSDAWTGEHVAADQCERAGQPCG